MKSLARAGSAAALLMLVAGCASSAASLNAGAGPARDQSGWPETRPFAGTLPVVDRPRPALFTSMTAKSLTDGRAKTFDVRAYGRGVRVRESDGCVWTSAWDWFSPSDSWAQCGASKSWRTAQARTRVIEPLYPLRLGARGVYERRAVSTSSGAVSTRQTECEVADQVEVLRAGAPATPAYVVRCDDGRIERVTWFAPDQGPIAYREAHKERGVREAWVRIR